MYHNKYWSVKKELMIKTSFLDDRHELPEIYLDPAEHLPWVFFAKIVNNFWPPLTNLKKNNNKKTT